MSNPHATTKESFDGNDRLWDGRERRDYLAEPAEKANAQNAQFLRELHAAMDRAVGDDDVRVIVLRANGKHFSAGHDIAGFFTEEEHAKIHGREGRGTRDHYAFEDEMFVRWTREWRDAPKPVIAACQGAVVASGLMLAWHATSSSPPMTPGSATRS